MNKKILLLTLSISLSSFSQTTQIPNICEAAFLRNYASYFVKTEYIGASALSKEKILKLSEVDDVPKRISNLEKEYELVSREYREKIDDIEEEFTRIGKESKLSYEELQDMMSSPKQEALIESLEQVNAITRVAHQTMKKEGMSIALKERAVDGSKVRSLYLEIVELPTKKYFNSVATINRYKKRFGTKTVTFDFMQNMKSGSAGFSQSSTKRIDLGFRGMRNMLLDDLITMVGKHEFKHAAFASNRITGRESIYHAQYIAYGADPISSVPNHYNRYMSAEELYNFTNNPYWASTRIGDITKYKPQDYLNDLSGIFYYIKSTNKIAAQTKEVTQTVINHLETLLKNPENIGASTVFLNTQGKVARTASEVESIGFILADREIRYVDWIGGDEFKGQIKHIMDNRLKLDKKYDAAYREADEDGQALILEKFGKEEAKLNSEKTKLIINKLLEKQKTLSKVAENIIPLNEEAVRRTEQFISYFKMRRKIDPNFLKSVEAKEEFLKLRLMYRKLGNNVKENYKGFVGI